MFNSHMANAKHFNEGGTYGQNLWKAFQVFLTALFDVKPPYKLTHKESEELREMGINEMYKLAKQFDRTMPNQAAELRYLASRDCTTW